MVELYKLVLFRWFVYFMMPALYHIIKALRLPKEQRPWQSREWLVSFLPSCCLSCFFYYGAVGGALTFESNKKLSLRGVLIGLGKDLLLLDPLSSGGTFSYHFRSGTNSKFPEAEGYSEHDVPVLTVTVPGKLFTLKQGHAFSWHVFLACVVGLIRRKTKKVVCSQNLVLLSLSVLTTSPSPAVGAKSCCSLDHGNGFSPARYHPTDGLSDRRRSNGDVYVLCSISLCFKSFSGRISRRPQHDTLGLYAGKLLWLASLFLTRQHWHWWIPVRDRTMSNPCNDRLCIGKSSI